MVDNLGVRIDDFDETSLGRWFCWLVQVADRESVVRMPFRCPWYQMAQGSVVGCRPQMACYVDVDAAFISSAGQMGAGVAVRNVEGVLIAACSKQFSSVQSVEMANSLRRVFGLDFALQNGFQRIVAETGSKTLHSALLRQQLGHAPFLQIAEDCVQRAHSFVQLLILLSRWKCFCSWHCLVCSRQDVDLFVHDVLPPQLLSLY
ncbi:hypothetical protein GH714_032440 [Hevea brasiliensis]|uniref:RNase H type-1 domain-containing protein n=1 Tax=Hevea brasiliensis TaxID=3981 RepID=A0A6A6NKG7_HEVBR|nr:hypothetical protein GH714_032440 [Hevea brasiliensis]